MAKGATNRCIQGECSCLIAPQVRLIYDSSRTVQEIRPDVAQFVKRAFRCLKELVQQHYLQTAAELGVALGATFDLCLSLLYAERVAHRQWLYCPRTPPKCFYTYLKSCPRCGRIDEQARVAHKPSSDSIGRYTTVCLTAILDELCKRTQNGWRVRLIASARGEVDLLLVSNKQLILGEVKASPLVAFPIGVLLEESLEEEVGGEQRYVNRHISTDVLGWKSQPVYLFVPDVNRTIPLRLEFPEGGQAHTVVPDRNHAELTEDLKVVIDAWKRMLDGYTSRWNQYADLRWFTFGCGGEVDDSKNAPGLDRTDDIKKGLYQAIKLTEKYRMNCSKQRVRVGLISNIHPVVHYSEYLQGVEDAVWTHESKLESDQHAPALWKRVRASDLSPFYDVLFTLTGSWFRNPEIERAFAMERLYRALGGES